MALARRMRGRPVHKREEYVPVSVPSCQSPSRPTTSASGADAELIEPSDPRWQAFLRRVPHDVYHLPAYAALSARYRGGHAVALLATCGATQMLLPLRIRDLPADLHAPIDWRDAVSPYGYPGPLVTDPADRAGIAACLEALGDVGRAAGLVSAFVRLHPLLSLAPVEAELPGRVEHHGSVVYVDLSRPLDELWSETRSNHRRGIRKLIGAGFEAAMDDWSTYADFVRLYEATMRRVEASAFYFFTADYYEGLRTALAKHVHLCTVRAPDGRVASAGIFFETAGIVQYHLGGTAEDFLAVAPSKLMFDAVRRWARDRGNRVLHLGGGLGAQEDSLFHFKAGFSPLRAPFHTFRVVLHQDRYADLVRRAGGSSRNGFFPAYRAA